MVDQIQLTSLHYMFIDGQPQLVEGGSIVNVPDASAFRGSSTLVKSNVTASLPIPTSPTKVTARSR